MWKINANTPQSLFVHAGFGRNDGWFDARIVKDGEDVISAPSEESGVTELDRIYTVSEPGQFGQRYKIELDILERPYSTNDTPQISLTANGGVELDFNILKTVEDGIEDTVTLSTPQRTLNLSVSGSIRDSGQSLKTFESFVVNNAYLAYHCEDQINSRIQGATTAQLPIFSDYTASNLSGNYTRNPDCWAYGIDMTCFSPWNSRGAHRRAGTLLAPRIVIQCKHSSFHNFAGDTIRFVTQDNVTVTRTVVSIWIHPSADFVLLLLNEDVPETISITKVLPTNYADYLPSGPRWIAALCLDQEEKALVTDLNSFSTVASFRYPDQPYEQVLYEDKIVGDSGNPAFLVVDGQLVILTAWTFGGAGSGAFVTAWVDSLNGGIATLYTNAELVMPPTIQTVNLSGFTNFANP